jgi:pimeloyl-ACP methyl ester carboxylesterase
MPHLDLPHGKLAYREAGSGTPLILVHGSPGEGRSWGRVLPKLEGRHRVLMPDLPGYGGSAPVPQAPEGRTATIGAAIAALVESCGEPVRLCGHSYGGNVALHAALGRPDRIVDLTVLEPVFFRALELTGNEAVRAPAARFFAGYADRVTGGRPEAVSEMVDFWFGDGAFPRLPAPVQGFLTAAAPKNGLDVRSSLAEAVTREQLAGFAKPVLVAYGGASPPVAPAIAEALASLLPMARLQAIPGAGHGMLDSHPDAIAALLLG